MTTLKGETVEPELADDDQISTILKINKIGEQIKLLAGKSQQLLDSLPTNTPLVYETDDGVYRTFASGPPVGHYVTYRKNDVLMDVKTTKADLKTLKL